MKQLLLMTAFVFGSFAGKAQPPTYKLPADLVTFFQGKWTGEGQFANGKKIAADVTFSLSLDSAWLSCSHADHAPDTYKAMLMWGVERSNGKFLAYNFDNFQGHRQFESDGYKNGKLVLSISQEYPDYGKVYEHFIYQQLSDNSFKMTYEVSKDGVTWQLGDFLVFRKTAS